MNSSMEEQMQKLMKMNGIIPAVNRKPLSYDVSHAKFTKEWTVDQVYDWARKDPEISKHAEYFLNQEINGEQLLELTLKDFLSDKFGNMQVPEGMVLVSKIFDRFVHDELIHENNNHSIQDTAL